MTYTEDEMNSIRGELEIVQRALKLQTKRCRQLVAEYTRRLQEKEQQYYSERALRDDQLAKVLRALLIFEARLRQEQKFISHQLNEKDAIINKAHNDLKKLLANNQYCKSCNQYYISSPIQESLDSSSEYVVTDYQDYQSSNFESLDSSSETYATISETGKGYQHHKSDSSSSYLAEDHSKSESIESNKNLFQKNRNKDSLGRKSRKIQHRKSIGTYFEVLKMRNDNASPCSNEDNTSNDYDNLDSLPPESVTEKISLVSENIESMFSKTQENFNGIDSSSPNVSISECNNTVISKNVLEIEPIIEQLSESPPSALSKITDSIPVFDGDGGETNDNWYASASDQEDEEQRDIYRNNPVLECMNQILLQNINDPLNSPPKTPNVERKSLKNKRVKFSDEEDNKQDVLAATKNGTALTKENLGGYYETPIQKTPNFYETPQSIYSNDYEQILSKCSETFSNCSQDKERERQLNFMAFKKLGIPKSPDPQPNHYYVDMDPKIDDDNIKDNVVVRRSKILRTPPALPPKPANLVSRYKIQNLPPRLDEKSDELEPDYCSISELNLPPSKNVSFKKINVVAEINSPKSNDVRNKLEKAASFNCKKPAKGVDDCPDYDPVVVNNSPPVLVVKKCVEKMNIQLAKQIKSDKSDQDIPKLPQVSEIIIPDETDDDKTKEERITQDNYVKNNSQIFKLKSAPEPRRPIVIGSSVSSLITGFNNQQLLSEIKKKPERAKLNKVMFASFENLQNLDKHGALDETPAAATFDLSQNFEEFKLDDCEIEEYNVDEVELPSQMESSSKPQTPTSTRVDLIRATNDVLVPNLSRSSIDLLKKQLELQKNQIPSEQVIKENSRYRSPGVEPTYEHFLECTGLSSKSILTPSRLLSNHKSMLKPKDVKLRSKVKANHLIERHSTSSIKYWSEPYI